MSNNIIGILDYESGNTGSVVRAVKAIGIHPVIVKTPEDILKVDKLIFPGVGAANQAMSTLRETGLDKAIMSHAQSRKPLLGVCVGMQVLGLSSEEGNTDCLGLLPYRLQHMTSTEPIPHMGWNDLEWNGSHPQLSQFSNGLSEHANVYYVHSYSALLNENESPDWLMASTEYGGLRIVGAVAYHNIWGTQFHTEKSGEAGLQILKNFAAL